MLIPSALFGRLVISWESPGRPRPTPSPGESSAGTAAMPPSPGSNWAERTGARPSPVLPLCSSRSRSPSPALDAMARCSGRPGWPICICGQIAPLGQRARPTEYERAGTQIRPAKEGGSRCHRSGLRRMLPQARRARRRSRSQRRRPRAGSSRGWDRRSQVRRRVHRGCPRCKQAVGHGQPGAEVRVGWQNWRPACKSRLSRGANRIRHPTGLGSDIRARV